MRHSHTALAFVALVIPVAACQVEASYPRPVVQAQVDVQPAPPPQVDVQAQVDPNAQVQQQPDPNAQTQATGDVQDNDPAALTDFHDALAPYGQWIDDPQYGTIWTPNPAVVGGDFTPYQTAGHWVYDNDYTWVSDYDWGWAPFHYGRWTSMGPGRGWGWIPGKEYAGAWVTWRNGDDGYGFAGWAPTPPSYYWRGGQPIVLQQPWYPPSYAYVETGNLFAPSIGVRVIRDPVRVREFEARTRVFAPSGAYANSNGIRMRVRGPAPTRFGLREANLPHAPANNPGLVHAQQFAHAPHTNVSMNTNVHGTAHVDQHAPDTHVQQQTSHVGEHAPDTHVQQQTGHVDQHAPDVHVQQQQQVQQQQHVQQTPEQVHTTPVQHVTPVPSASQRRPPQPTNTGHQHH